MIISPFVLVVAIGAEVDISLLPERPSEPPCSLLCMSAPVGLTDTVEPAFSCPGRTTSLDIFAYTEKELTNGQASLSSSDIVGFRVGEHLLPNGDLYSGSLLGNMPESSGKYIWSDGCIYEGEWRRGMRHGHGKTQWPSGAVYDLMLSLQLGISSYGQSLSTSTFIGETIFAILIAIFGLVLFAHLIGNMQHPQGVVGGGAGDGVGPMARYLQLWGDAIPLRIATYAYNIFEHTSSDQFDEGTDLVKHGVNQTLYKDMNSLMKRADEVARKVQSSRKITNEFVYRLDSVVQECNKALHDRIVCKNWKCSWHLDKNVGSQKCGQPLLNFVKAFTKASTTSSYLQVPPTASSSKVSSVPMSLKRTFISRSISKEPINNKQGRNGVVLIKESNPWYRATHNDSAITKVGSSSHVYPKVHVVDCTNKYHTTNILTFPQISHFSITAGGSTDHLTRVQILRWHRCGCEYFKWFDLEMTDRATIAINGLLRKSDRMESEKRLQDELNG
ncbi:hypothetical protein Syun_014817 [Stephania yunnanensis]|uniref:Uncharacterized protein n=1 Tax=Stephania yunnanensis TaxID=152371 RepID=A0AAP0P953_9MAGN